MVKHLNRNFYFFPFLFGLYPVLALIAHNSAEMDLIDGVRALLGSILFVLLLNTIVLLSTKNSIKSALITTILILLFFSYGHINLISRAWSILGLSLGRHRTLIPIYGIILILSAGLIIRTKKDLSVSVRFLNAFSIILLTLPVIQIFSYQIGVFQSKQQLETALSNSVAVELSDDINPPDVYYIVVDGYPRGDFISEVLASSNLDFLHKLEERGFFVAHCSMSNYSDTRFSLASTLNMSYLDDGRNIPEVVFPGSTLDSMIRSGSVQKNFSDLGYTIVTFESGYKWLRWDTSDVHLDPAQKQRLVFLRGGLNSFEQLLVDTTAAQLVLDIPFLIERNQLETLENFVNNPREAHRERVLFALDQLGQLTRSIREPKFVYAHIIFPHPPFVVDAEGNPLLNSPEDEITAYADQITYLNRRLIDIVDQLIINSNLEPIIIIQGDHGATIDYESLEIDKVNRLGILNAYYLPERIDMNDEKVVNSYENLYPNITPVNSFRLIFDQYFGGNYGLLEDKSILGKQSPYITIGCNPP